MRKTFKIVLAALLTFSSYQALAASNPTLDEATIAKIHNEVQTSFAEKCKTDMKGSTTALCGCLADKMQANLDNTALSKCTNDMDGGKCVANEISKTVLKVMTKENIAACSATGNAAVAPTPTN